MAVTCDLPPALEAELRRESTDLNKDAREAVALELFRRGRLSHRGLSEVLGLDRFETSAYLQRHKVYEGSLTMADLDADRRTLDDVMGAMRR